MSTRGKCIRSQNWSNDSKIIYCCKVKVTRTSMSTRGTWIRQLLRSRSQCDEYEWQLIIKNLNIPFSSRRPRHQRFRSTPLLRWQNRKWVQVTSTSMSPRGTCIRSLPCSRSQSTFPFDIYSTKTKNLCSVHVTSTSMSTRRKCIRRHNWSNNTKIIYMDVNSR